MVRPTILETTALGAAYLAGLATNYWDSTDDVARNWQIDTTFEPRVPASEASGYRSRWTEAVKRSRGWEKSETT